jgi:outer membrane protein OmpA-like peptidoglycan-associated protein
MRPEHEAQFDELAEFITSYPDSLFKISGYLDMRASDIDRLKQALWTRKYLIEHYDIPSSMLLVAVGKLKGDPYIKDAKTEAEHELNRRVEIKFIKKK